MVKVLMSFFADLYSSRQLLYHLTVKDFKARYLGSYLGLFWAFIQPSVTILIFWFVFQVGFKSRPVDDYPFILWLLTGIVPWFYFAESFGNATFVIREYSYLVSKVVFRVSLLPIVKIVSSLMIHLFFVFVIFLFFILYKQDITIHSLQVIYYMFALVVLLLGLSWTTSSLNVFLKDVGQFVQMTIQFGFWGTPIFWSIGIIPEKYQVYLKLNPVFYITEGYREALIYKIWFWEHPYYTIYFWCITVMLFCLGAIVFRVLRPHFADVL